MSAKVRPLMGGAVQLEIMLLQAGQARLRWVRAANCREALEAAALIVALALDPRLSDQPTPPRCTACRKLLAALESRVSEPTTRGERLGEEASPAAGEWRLGAALVTSLWTRQLPDPSPAFGLGLVVESSHLMFLVSTQIARDVAWRQDEGAAFYLAKGRALGCWMQGGGPWALGPCAGLEVGLLRAAGFGLDVNQQANELWSAGALGLALHYRHGRRAFAHTRLDAVFPWSHPDFQLDSESFFRPPDIGASADIAVGLTFP